MSTSDQYNNAPNSSKMELGSSKNDGGVVDVDDVENLHRSTFATATEEYEKVRGSSEARDQGEIIDNDGGHDKKVMVSHEENKKLMLEAPTSSSLEEGPALKKMKISDEEKREDKDSSKVTGLKDGKFYRGCRPLYTEKDRNYLTSFHCLLRKEIFEVYSSSLEDVKRFFSAPGRFSRPLSEGQVGIRCKFCKGGKVDPNTYPGICFPFSIKNIYSQVLNLAKEHILVCEIIPSELKVRVLSFQNNPRSRTGRKEYWVESAKAIGIKDSPYGMYFGCDPSKTLADEAAWLLSASSVKEVEVSKTSSVSTSKTHFSEYLSSNIVTENEKGLIADYLFLAMQQMERCVLSEYDKIGCYRVRDLGFPGLACKWCRGQPGSGRYFPASEASLSQTTTSHTILNHIKMCRHCPSSIREELDTMQRASPSKKEKPRHGGRKVFFHRLWCRIQGIDDSTKYVENSVEKKTGKAAANAFLKELEKTYEKAPEELELSVDSRFSGTTSLSSVDDNVILSPRWCILRRKCITVFSASQEDVDRSQIDDENIALNQVGVRCTFCGHLRDGLREYPASVRDMHATVNQWDTEHFSVCPNIPSDILKELQTLSDMESTSITDKSRYWNDAAREIGITETKEGLFFDRNPYGPSPTIAVADSSDGELITYEEKDLVPDSIYLMMKQGRRCSLNKTDQSKGVSDRRLGFPGICCKHCGGLEDDAFIGRFFPYTKKMISESFPHSFYTHILSCSKCPQSVKIALRYLEHRASMQEKKLGRSWKKRFFAKSLWKKIHENSISPERRLSFSKTDDTAEVVDNDGSSTSSEDSVKPNHDFIRVAALWLIDQKQNFRNKKS